MICISQMVPPPSTSAPVRSYMYVDIEQYSCDNDNIIIFQASSPCFAQSIIKTHQCIKQSPRITLIAVHAVNNENAGKGYMRKELTFNLVRWISAKLRVWRL